MYKGSHCCNLMLSHNPISPRGLEKTIKSWFNMNMRKENHCYNLMLEISHSNFLQRSQFLGAKQKDCDVLKGTTLL